MYAYKNDLYNIFEIWKYIQSCKSKYRTGPPSANLTQN